MSAKFKAPPNTPPWTRGGPRPSDGSQPSLSKKRKTSLPQQVVNLSNDEADDEDYCLSEEDEDDKEEGRDDVPMGNLDPANEFATPPHRPSINVLDSIPSTGTPSSNGTPGASSSMGQRKKRKKRDPMASILESLTTMMAES